MKIRYLGHSSFLLTTDGGTRIVTDPYGGVGFPFPYVTADLVTVSHGHFDHNRVAAVGGSPAVFDRAGKLEFGDVKLESFRHFHDDVQGKKRGEDLVFRMEADGLVLVHMGDIGEPFAPSIVEELGHVDILCIPVGGNYTVDAAGAKEYTSMTSRSSSRRTSSAARALRWSFMRPLSNRHFCKFI